VRLLLSAGLDYSAVAEWLGIPVGQAYLIATGRVVDGSDTPANGESQADGPLASSQHLADPPPESPTGSESVQAAAAVKAAGTGVAAVNEVRDAARDRPAKRKDKLAT
jgi:hypothetical protein